MVNREEALGILNREKDYEDKLVADISSYFLLELDSISGLNAEEKELLRKNLTTILNESMIHSNKFGELIQMVLENGETNSF
jgi:hypothetical protein